VDPKLFFSDPDPTFQEISGPDPISDPPKLIKKEAKPKFETKTATLIVILKEVFLKSN